MASATTTDCATPSPVWQVARTRRVGFTLWNLAFAILSLVSGHASLVAIAFCSSFGVVASFHIGWLFDPCGVARLIRKNNLPRGKVFHFYNILMHVVPLVVLWLYIHLHAVPVELHHGLWSSVFHFTWGLIETHGHLLLDDIYVDMDPHHWHSMWVTAIIVECLAPYLL
eukprot:m.63119 g.63119  ORF g.63119 m.63119 type:complete len:169 (-) comp13955_c0_seq1:1115-1621(-)